MHTLYWEALVALIIWWPGLNQNAKQKCPWIFRASLRKKLVPALTRRQSSGTDPWGSGWQGAYSKCKCMTWGTAPGRQVHIKVSQYTLRAPRCVGMGGQGCIGASVGGTGLRQLHLSTSSLSSGSERTLCINTAPAHINTNYCTSQGFLY